MHSTLARSHAEHAGNLPSHFCLRDLHLVQEEMALATLYVGCWSFNGVEGMTGDGRELELELERGGGGGPGCENE